MKAWVQRRGVEWVILRPTLKVCVQDAPRRRLDTLPRPLFFLNGVLDVLLRGHVNYLNQAAALGGLLIVAFNLDV